MITKIERIFAEANFNDLRSAFISRARLESGRISDSREWMLAHGFEMLDAHENVVMTDDGRQVMHALGKAWALRQEVHLERRQSAIEKAKQREVSRRDMQTADVRESIAATVCPQMQGGKPCGGSLNKKGVCPSCVTGRMGYRYRYTCESCGFDVVTKTELTE